MLYYYILVFIIIVICYCLLSYNLKSRLLNMNSLFIFPRRSVYPPADRNQAPNDHLTCSNMGICSAVFGSCGCSSYLIATLVYLN